MFVGFIGDLDSDMYVARLWGEPEFMYTFFFHCSYL